MEVMKKIRSLKEVMDAKPKHRKLKKGRYKKKKHKPIKFKKVKKITKKKVIKKKRSYKEYLKSDTWKIKRDKVIKRAKNKCEICNTNRAWQVHHITYKRIFAERLSDLIATCETCHKAEHNLLTDEEIETAILDLIKSEGYK